MKQLVILFAGLLTLNVFAADVLKVGDTVPDMCWKDADNQELCLANLGGRVRVLLYNTGWCPACNEEMEELIPKLVEFEDQPVTFLSLSAQGFTSAAPDSQFLKDWKAKHQIPFPVLASPKDPGKKFFEPPFSIPAVVVITKDGKLLYKEQGPEVDTFLERVRFASAIP